VKEFEKIQPKVIIKDAIEDKLQNKSTGQYYLDKKSSPESRVTSWL